MANYRGKAPITKQDLRRAKQDAKIARRAKMSGSGNHGFSGISKKTLIIIASSILGVVVIGMLIFIITQRRPSEQELLDYMENGIFVSTTTVESVDISGQTISEARLSLSDNVKSVLSEANVSFSVDNKEYTEDAMSLGLITDIEDVLIDAMLFEKEGPIFQRSKNAGIAESEGIHFEIKVVAVPETVEASILKLVSKYNIEPTEPFMSFNPEAKTEEELISWESEVAGIAVDEQEFANKVVEQVNLGNFSLGELKTTVLSPEKTKADLEGSVVKLSEYTTYYGFGEFDEDNRVFNISFMSEMLTGGIVEPGENWSINDTTGERSEEAGWKTGKAIRRGVLVDELGGGVCQVSGTLYNAFLLAELGIVERHNHTYQSVYIDLYARDARIKQHEACDATIDYGNKDLIIKNTLSDTIYIVVISDQEAETVTAQVYGPPPEHDYQVIIRTIEYKTLEPTADPEYRVAEGGLAPDGEFVYIGQKYGYPGAQNGSVWYTYRYYYPKDYDFNEDPAYSWIGYDGTDRNSGEKVRLKIFDSDKYIDSVYPSQNGVYYLNPNDPLSLGLPGSTYDPNANPGGGNGSGGGGDGGEVTDPPPTE